MLLQSASLLMLALTASAEPYNTYDGPGFPACHDVAAVYNPKTVDDIQAVVQGAIAAGQKVRASGLGHMWYDTMCSDDPNTVIIKTEEVHNIYDLDIEGGSVWFEAGVTFIQLAEWLHERGASVGYTLVNWNITLAGSVAMGAHRSSIREDSMCLRWTDLVKQDPLPENEQDPLPENEQHAGLDHDELAQYTEASIAE
ncbi:hypothetical protein BN1723_007369 [Verticillium longisporum]|uniref:FAD-binding PCMH-type domain-containing protein n=1 Tax=Verticillium longisporum TaxID=100787 RepID=A0A0G4NL33_VERLO|nr:hypothetical protein BN1723_007369 [Verticillium longisporum]